MLPPKQYYQFNCLVLISLMLFVLYLCPAPANCDRTVRKTCPPLAPAKGMALSCFRRHSKHQHELYLNSTAVSTELNSREKTTFSRMHSSDNCAALPAYSPGTVAHYKCLPYFTTKDNTTSEGGFLKCTRMGNWRHKNRFNNFSCHLRAEGWINKLIDENRVVIFSKSYCIYCTRVKELFRALRVNYQAIELDHFDSARQAMIREALWKKTGMKTWPNIFINRQHLGGYDKTIYGYHDGSLHRMLNAHRNLLQQHRRQ